MHCHAAMVVGRLPGRRLSICILLRSLGGDLPARRDDDPAPPPLRLEQPLHVGHSFRFVRSALGTEREIGAVVRELHEIPEQAIVIALLAGDLHDRGEALVIHVRAKEQIAVVPSFAEGDLHEDRVAVTVDDSSVVLTITERAVNEELRTSGPFVGVSGDKLTRINEEVLTAFEVDFVRVHPIFQTFGARENQALLTLAQTMDGLRADEARVTGKSGFEKSTRRYPELINPDTLIALVNLRVLKPEELTETFTMIVVEVGDADSVVVVWPMVGRMFRPTAQPQPVNGCAVPTGRAPCPAALKPAGGLRRHGPALRPMRRRNR